MLVWCMFNGVLWWTMLSHWSSALDNFTVCQHQDLTLVKIRPAYSQQPNLYLEPKWLRCQIFKLEYFQAPQIKKQLSTQPHTWQKRRPTRNTSQWSVTSFTSWRCAQPFSSTLYCTTLHLCIDCPMIYFEVAAQSTLSLSGGCCYHGFRQQSWGSMLTVQTHVLHILLFCTMRSEVFGLVAVFVCFNQDLWSWMLAILQNIMPSLLIHLRHTLTNSLLGLGHDCWFPSKCWAVLSRWAEAEISL